MSLAGLLDRALADPALAQVVASVGTPDLEVSAPAGLRPFVGGNLGLGSAITLFLFPLLFVGVIIFLRMLYRREAL